VASQVFLYIVNLFKLFVLFARARVATEVSNPVYLRAPSTTVPLPAQPCDTTAILPSLGPPAPASADDDEAHVDEEDIDDEQGRDDI